MATPLRPIHPNRRERGAALVISLILLVVMTLLGISSMNSSIMQELMSSSYRAQTATLSTAELITAEGERQIVRIVYEGSSPQAGYYDLSDADNPIDEPLDVKAWDFATYTYDDDDGSGEYVIEYIGRREVPGESIAEGEEVAGSYVSVFRVSARSEGDRGARRLVQTIFVTFDQPPRN